MKNIEFKKITDLGERFLIAYYNLIITLSKKDKKLNERSLNTVLAAQAQSQAIIKKYNIVSAIINGQAIGSITYTPVLRGHSIRIETLSILPTYQRKGIGKALVNFVLNENKNKPINVSAFIDNEIAVTFWNSVSQFKKIPSNNNASEVCFSTNPKSNKTFVVVNPTKEMIEHVRQTLNKTNLNKSFTDVN